MEGLFGADFSAVRVHVGPEAPALGALAFAMGSQLFFAPGQYDPSTPRGQRLLAHELTHVLQQRAGRVQNPFGDGLALVQNPALEAEAERSAQRAMRLAPAGPRLPGRIPVQRAVAPHSLPPARGSRPRVLQRASTEVKASPGMGVEKIALWKKLVTAGTAAGAGHNDTTRCDLAALRVRENGGFSAETTCAVAVSGAGGFVQVIAACKGYQGNSAEKNKLINETLEYELKLGEGSWGIEVAPCPDGYHAEMAIAKSLGNDVAGYEFGASIGCCPLCMAYLSEKGATFGKAGGEPKLRWRNPLDGEELANPAQGYEDLLLS